MKLYPLPNNSRTSMARTSLGSQKFVLAMGSSSHYGLIIVPGLKANRDNLGLSSVFYKIMLYLVYS